MAGKAQSSFNDFADKVKFWVCGCLLAVSSGNTRQAATVEPVQLLCNRFCECPCLTAMGDDNDDDDDDDDNDDDNDDDDDYLEDVESPLS